jgi:hypothetical protein
MRYLIHTSWNALERWQLCVKVDSPYQITRIHSLPDKALACFAALFFFALLSFLALLPFSSVTSGQGLQGHQLSRTRK